MPSFVRRHARGVRGLSAEGVWLLLIHLWGGVPLTQVDVISTLATGDRGFGYLGYSAETSLDTEAEAVIWTMGCRRDWK